LIIWLDGQVQVNNEIPSVSNLPMSPQDILEGVTTLKSVLDVIGTYSNVVDGVIKATQGLAQVSRLLLLYWHQVHV
jgi:hypothetical protein